MPVLQALRDHTKESSQLFRRQGDYRVCVAASEREMGLRDSIPVGATLSMSAGSAAQVLLAWEEPDRLHRGLYGASGDTTSSTTTAASPTTSTKRGFNAFTTRPTAGYFLIGFTYRFTTKKTRGRGNETPD